MLASPSLLAVILSPPFFRRAKNLSAVSAVNTSHRLDAFGVPHLPKACTMNTYAKSASNSSTINTYKIAGLKVAQNQHLQKKWGPGVLMPTMTLPSISGHGGRMILHRILFESGKSSPHPSPLGIAAAAFPRDAPARRADFQVTISSKRTRLQRKGENFAPMRGTSGSVQRFPVNSARPGREQR